MKFLITLLFLAVLFPGNNFLITEQEPRNWLAGIELGISEHYDQAISFFTQISDHDSTNPAPHFFLATIWQTRMMDFETAAWQDSFMSEIEETVELSQTRLEDEPNNIDMQYFYASALAYKSFQISRQGQYLSGLRLGLQAVQHLENIVAQDSAYYDAYLGIGSYLYWRSYLTRNFAWLPFFNDQRDKGIALIQTSFEKGTISKWAALSNLAWIYIKEERFEEAIEYAQAGLSTFPNSRFFLWPLGDAQFYQHDFAGALETYQRLLDSVTLEEFNNRYNETVLHLKIATCFFELNHVHKAKIHAQTVLDIEPHDEVIKRLKEKKRDAKELLKRIDELSASANE